MNPPLPYPQPARPADARRRDEAWIDEALRESFPASDPPSWTLGTTHDTAARQDAPPVDRRIR